MNRRHADFQSDLKPIVSLAYQSNDRQTAHLGSMGYAGIVKPGNHLAKENPGALAGASGALDMGNVFKSQAYRNRAAAATSLALAIANCDPSDACEIMAAALSDLSIGMPIAPLISVMDEAGFWADLATQDELKAYTLACFTRMTPRNKAAFLGYVGGLQ